MLVALIRDQQYSNTRTFWYLGQLLEIQDCPGDSGTVVAYGVEKKKKNNNKVGRPEKQVLFVWPYPSTITHMCSMTWDLSYIS